MLFAVRLVSLESAADATVGSEDGRDAFAPLPSLEAAALRAYTMVPQLVKRLLEEATSGMTYVEVYSVSDNAPQFRIVFHNSGVPAATRRFQVVLHNWTDAAAPPTVIGFGKGQSRETKEAWQAAARFCFILKGFFEKMLKAYAEPSPQAKTILELRDKAAGDRALVTLLGF